MNSKAKFITLVISQEEIKRICNEKLGFISIEVIATHANVKVIAKTEQNQKIKAHFKQKI